MERIPRTSFDDKLLARAGADPLDSPGLCVVHRFGEREWGEPGHVPLVTVALGDHSALLRFTDSDAQEPLTAEQWSCAQEVAERVAVPIGEGDDRPAVFVHRTLVVGVPSFAVAERLARFLLTLALPAGSLP